MGKNKYQRALVIMKQGRTWQSVADELSDVLEETIHRSDVHGTAKGKWSSWKVHAALELMEAVTMPKERSRLAADFIDDKQRNDFKDYYGIDNNITTFTDWVHLKWEIDRRT